MDRAYSLRHVVRICRSLPGGGGLTGGWVSRNVVATPEVIGWRSPTGSSRAWFGTPAERRAFCEITVDRYTVRNVMRALHGDPAKMAARRQAKSTSDVISKWSESRRQRAWELTWERAKAHPTSWLVRVSFAWQPDIQEYRVDAGVCGGRVRRRGGDSLPYPSPQELVWYDGTSSLRLVAAVVTRASMHCREVDGRDIVEDRSVADAAAVALNGRSLSADERRSLQRVGALRFALGDGSC